MKKEQRHIPIIVTSISVALLGLMILQIFLLIESYHQKEQAFDRNVMNALTEVSQRMEKEEAASKIFNVAMQFPQPPSLKGGKKTVTRFIGKDSAVRKNAATGTVSWVVSDSAEKSGQMRVEVFHATGVDTMTTVVVKKKPGKSNQSQSMSYSYSTDENMMKITAGSGGVHDSMTVLLRDTTKQRRGEIVARVVDKLFLVEMLPIEERIDLGKLDSMIHTSLSAVGIAMKYSFRVTVGEDDSVRLSSDSLRKEVWESNQYNIKLFPNDVLSPRYQLALLLPEKSSFVMGEMLLMAILSSVFLVIIVAGIVYTVRVMMMQKSLAAAIIDFINNMTHEFKTPISTIALASEALAKPEVLKSKTKIAKYNSLIAAENTRMKQQVDKILQMAVLEEGEFELKASKVDIHALVQQAVINISLQIENRNGKITTNLAAKQCTVLGDTVHLVNIIHNVLDNAVKYTTSVPTITIETKNSDGMILLRFIDNGIGIANDELHRVFDKYYRVSTGNTHDVKGFGLGLSYVALMVKAHKGSISIDSQIGKGTTVEIQLPIV